MGFLVLGGAGVVLKSAQDSEAQRPPDEKWYVKKPDGWYRVKPDPSSFTSDAAVRDAYRAGRLSREQAEAQLRRFGYE